MPTPIDEEPAPQRIANDYRASMRDAGLTEEQVNDIAATAQTLSRTSSAPPQSILEIGSRAVNSGASLEDAKALMRQFGAFLYFPGVLEAVWDDWLRERMTAQERGGL